MSANASSNGSQLHPNASPASSSFSHMLHCFMSRRHDVPLITFNVACVLLLLPLGVLVLYLGLQRRATSHSDSFAYHAVAMELVCVAGSTSCCCGVLVNHFTTAWVGLSLVSFTSVGEVFFHFLTCVEPYLAVVHPLVYLGLRKERGTRIRNIAAGCVWLLSITLTCLVIMDHVLIGMHFSLLVLIFIAISFCGASVLCVLIRPGPGEQGGDRERADQSKLRALYTIMAITLVLLLKCSINLVWTLLSLMKLGNECVVMACSLWFNLPGSLALPVLFLHRAGKLQCCHNLIKPGPGSD